MKSYALSTESQYVAVAATSAKFAAAMAPNTLHRFTSSVDCWVNIGLTGGAAVAATANNILCLAGHIMILALPYQPATSAASSAGFVHVIRDSADGVATLTPLVEVAG